MFVRFHVCPDWDEVKVTVRAKHSLCITHLENMVLHQMMIRPLEAPSDSTFSNLSKRRGKHFLMNE